MQTKVESDKELSHWLFLPDEAMDDLEILSGLSSEQISRLRDILDSSEFRPKHDLFLKVASLLNITDEAGAKVCTFINYVQSQRVKYKKKVEAVLPELDRFAKNALETKRGDQARRTMERLRDKKELFTQLFSEFAAFDFSQKLRGLETGPLTHLHSFRAYCDLRPVYDAGANKIVSGFPIITLCLVTHSSGTDESKEILVQLTESDLDDFREQFDRLNKKLAILKALDSSLLVTKKE